MTTSTNFLGIPVDGDIVHGEARREQKPLTELAPLIEAVLADEQIEAFGWRQYTPYFNDGDACIFGVHGFWVASVGDNYEDNNAGDLAVGEYSYGAQVRPLPRIVTDGPEAEADAYTIVANWDGFAHASLDDAKVSHELALPLYPASKIYAITEVAP